MSKNTKIWLVVAASLIIIGGAIFGGVMTMLKWDFTKLSTVKYETNNYEINEDYKNISVVTKTANIVLVPCEGSETSVVCHEQKNVKHLVTVKDDTLVIEVNDTRRWWEYIGITLGFPKITVYLPEAEYGVLRIKESTGDIEIPNDFKFESIDISASTGNVRCYADTSELIKIKLSTGDTKIEDVSAGAIDITADTGDVSINSAIVSGGIDIETDTGKIKLTGVTCKSLEAESDTGNISLSGVVADDSFSIEADTGDVRFEKSDASEIYVKTSTGDVKGSLLSEKIFIAETSTGKINVPKTTSGGRCEIKTSTGDIKLTVD